jgi:hypothetical protein
MRLITLSLLALALLTLAALTGCMTLHAQIPEDVVRQHVQNEEGIVLPAVCTHEGMRFSEGARVCMEKQGMSCDPSGRWLAGDAC